MKIVPMLNEGQKEKFEDIPAWLFSAQTDSRISNDRGAPKRPVTR